MVVERRVIARPPRCAAADPPARPRPRADGRRGGVIIPDPRIHYFHALLPWPKLDDDVLPVHSLEEDRRQCRSLRPSSARSAYGRRFSCPQTECLLCPATVPGGSSRSIGLHYRPTALYFLSMIRNLKALGLALVACLAMSCIAAVTLAPPYPWLREHIGTRLLAVLAHAEGLTETEALCLQQSGFLTRQRGFKTLNKTGQRQVGNRFQLQACELSVA